eukprot:378521_1
MTTSLQELGIYTRDTNEETLTRSVSQCSGPLSVPRGDLFKDTGPTGDASMWDWSEVQRWLRVNDLQNIIKMINEEFGEDGIDGEKLMHLNLDDVFWITTDDGFFMFQKALRKLRLKGKTSNEALTHDFVEMKRRIDIFIEKWDRILWIEHYCDINSRLPTEEDICNAFVVSISVAAAYLIYYKKKKTIKRRRFKRIISR